MMPTLNDRMHDQYRTTYLAAELKYSEHVLVPTSTIEKRQSSLVPCCRKHSSCLLARDCIHFARLSGDTILHIGGMCLCTQRHVEGKSCSKALAIIVSTRTPRLCNCLCPYIHTYAHTIERTQSQYLSL